MKAFYGAAVKTVVPVSSNATAEAVKLTENIFRSVNIALVNELKIVYAAMGIDVWEVIDAAKTKPFGYMPFYPGPGLGGHCIPIDPFYLTWKSREYELPTRFIELAGEINSAMPRYVVGKLAEALDIRAGKALSRSKVLVLGLAYKKNVAGYPREPVAAADRDHRGARRQSGVSRSVRRRNSADARISGAEGPEIGGADAGGAGRLRCGAGRDRPRSGRLRACLPETRR